MNGDDDSWQDVVYGNGTWVAIGLSGESVMTSSDGVNWTTQNVAGDNDNWLGLTYGNGLFVAVAANGDDRLMTSPDGVTWTTISVAGDDDVWTDVTYGNGLFVAVSTGGDDRLMTSPDGVTWTTVSVAGDNDSWYDVVYGNGRFVAVSSGGDRVMYSTDGIIWTTTAAAGDNDSWRGVTYGNGQFVAVASGGGDRLMTSPDGITWTARSVVGDDDNWRAVAYGNGLFVVVANGGDNRVITSVDGITWTAQTAAGDDDDWLGIAYNNGQFVAVGQSGDRVMTSGSLGQIELVTDNTYQGGINVFGNVGIGTSSPSATLDVWGNLQVGTSSFPILEVDTAAQSVALNGDTSVTDTFFVAATSTFNGRVGVGTTTLGSELMVDGDIDITGSYLTNGADYAEYFYTKDTNMLPGEVVCIDITENNAVKRCNTSSDTNVMGIVSTQPAFLGNASSDKRDNPNYVAVAMLGQIPAYVSTENGEVRAGDSLTAAQCNWLCYESECRRCDCCDCA